MSTLLLKLINQDGPGLRGGVDKDGVQAFSLFDLGNLACGKDRDSTYGKTNFYRLTKEGSAFKKEVDTLCIYLKFPGSGQRETPCATIRGLQRYLMMLGGKVAAEFRDIIEGTFTRVMAGDQSLIEVINANAVSQAPVQQAFRVALAQEHKQYVKGNYVPVNSYMERDRGLMEQAVREIMGDASESGSNHS
jgi:hypothetical protein